MTHTFEFSLISPQRSNNVPANEVATVAICEGIGIFSEVVLLDLTAWMSSGRRQPTKVARASVRAIFSISGFIVATQLSAFHLH
jgi:hypothetical protein